MTVLAIIPARGGSKGIPRKNLALLAGQPLIKYALDAARGCNSVTDLFVSTDDEEIAAVCEAAGVSVPCRRPKDLSGDRAGMAETVLHALDWWRDHRGGDPEIVVLLQPTSPLRRGKDIDGTVAALREGGCGSAISVHEMSEHPMECIRASKGSWSMLERPSPQAVGRQDYAGGYYFINGAVYAATPEFIRANRRFVGEGDQTALYVMDPLRGLDIDSPVELDLAEAIMSSPALRRRMEQ